MLLLLRFSLDETVARTKAKYFKCLNPRFVSDGLRVEKSSRDVRRSIGADELEAAGAVLAAGAHAA